MSLRDEINSGEYEVYKNKYLANAKLGLELLLKLQSRKKEENIKKEYQLFEELIEIDFLDLVSRSDLNQGVEFYQDLINLKEKLNQIIRFPFLYNKKVVAIGGRFSAGKSQFINSILKDTKLPIDTRPTTSIPSYISQTNQDEIFAYNLFDNWVDIDLDALEAISHSFYNEYRLSLTYIVKTIFLGSVDFPYQNIVLLDTPGYTKAKVHKKEDNTDESVAVNYLKKGDYLIWVIDIEQGTVSREDIEFITKLNFEKPIFFIFNKADKKPKSEVEEIIKEAKIRLAKTSINLAGITAYSSIDKQDYFDNRLVGFLNKVDKSSYNLDLESKVKDIIGMFYNHHQQKLEEASDEKTKIDKLNELLNLEQKSFRHLKRDTEIRSNKEKQLLDQFNKLNQRLISLLNKLLNSFEQGGI